MNQLMPTVKGLVVEYFETRPPLSVITNQDVYQYVIHRRPATATATIREAVQSLAVGSPRAMEKNTASLYAIYVLLPELASVKERAAVYVTIPAVSKDIIGPTAEQSTGKLRADLAAVYGQKTIKYWVGGGQLRSVDLISPKAKALVKQREGGVCKLCHYLAQAYAGIGSVVGSSILSNNQRPMRHTIAHLISRKSTYWRQVHHVHFKLGLNIFTDQGVDKIRELVANDPLHSDPRYMVYLCDYHDQAVQRVLKGHSVVANGI